MTKIDALASFSDFASAFAVISSGCRTGLDSRGACGIFTPGKIMQKNHLKFRLLRAFYGVCVPLALLAVGGCNPRIVSTDRLEGAPGTKVNLAMEYLIGWPRVEVGGKMMDWPQIRLMALNPERKDVRGEELIWIEDKILQFTIPDLPPGEYQVIIYDDKGPPGISSILFWKPQPMSRSHRFGRLFFARTRHTRWSASCRFNNMRLTPAEKAAVLPPPYRDGSDLVRILTSGTSAR